LQNAPPIVSVAVRDPFQVAAKAAQVKADPEAAGTVANQSATDPCLDLIRGLTLSGTFLQGRTQIAIISGQIYEKGQYLRGPGDEPSPLCVAQVLATGVILEAGGNQYMFSYPVVWAEAGAQPRSLASASKPRQAKALVVKSPKADSQAKLPPRSRSSGARQALNP
jgi:hypothetical protein